MTNQEDNNSKPKAGGINRRHFLGLMGTGAVAGAATLSGCGSSTQTQYDQGGHHTTEVPTDQMTYRTNPHNGDKVSILGYGCMRWPTLKDPDNPDRDISIDQETVNELVDYALAHGVNYFDSSPVYVRGWSEEATGKALARHPRDSYFVATKCSNFGSNDYDAGVQMYRKSLENFHTDHIDYYLMHSIGGGGVEALKARYFDNGLVDFFLKEKEAGHIRNFGWSFHGDVEVFDYMMQLHDSGEFHSDFVQIQMNYLDWKIAQGASVGCEYLYNELEKRNIPVVIMEPLLGGRLANLPIHIVSRLKQANYENSVASWAFRFCGSYPDVLCVLSGMTYMENLQDNVRSFAPLVELTDDEKEFLYETASLINEYPTIPCNQCQYCMPCPYALDIPAILTHYNKCVNEGNVPESSQDPNYRKARQAFLVGYDRSVPKLRQADHCTNCGQCVPHCPQQIQIPQEMTRISEFVEKLKQNTL